MTLPASGALSLSAINTEFGRGTNLNSYRGTTWYTDAGGSGTFSAGAIAISDFYSKRLTSPMFSFTISSNQTNANLRALAVAAGWNQSSALTATINSGVTVYSTSTGTPALTVNGSFPGGVTLVNNGTVLGAGGAGGRGSDATSTNPAAGGSGGLALSVSVAVSINNANRIAGGGGGGGGGQRGFFNPGGKGGTYSGAGGGGGGGIGNGTGASGGSGGDAPAAGTGGTGTLTANGAGGTKGGVSAGAGAGGAGGSYGAAGAQGGTGASYGPGASGGAAGGAVAGNTNITWIATGTRNGGIS